MLLICLYGAVNFGIDCDSCLQVVFDLHSGFCCSVLTYILQNCSIFQLCHSYSIVILFRSLRRIRQRSRTMVFGCATRVVQDTTTCTRSTETPPWTERWKQCTPKWLLAIGSGLLASKSSRQPPSLPSSARGKAPSNSMTLRSNSPWCSGLLGHPQESWRPLTRLQGPICLCNLLV